MSRRSDAVKKWRHLTKKRIIVAMGGCCQICGYNKCQSALALHHLDPKEKEMSFGRLRANPKSWEKVVPELRKCVLVCHNCHSEVHAGLIDVPITVKRFDETFIEYRITAEKCFDKCPRCDKLKPITNKFCSLSCSGKRKHKIDWSMINVVVLMKRNNYNFCKAGAELGISDNAVRKQYKKFR